MLKNNKQIITVLDCKRCNWQWPTKRPDNVKVCPKCKTAYWDRDRLTTHHQDNVTIDDLPSRQHADTWEPGL